MIKNRTLLILIKTVIIAIVLCACNLPAMGTSTPENNNIQENQSADINNPPENTPINNPNIITQTLDETATPTITYTPTYLPSPTKTPVPLANLPKSNCASLFVEKDVTINDGTKLKPGEIFTKIWRINNNGNCAWDSNYKLLFYKGDQMNGPEESMAYFLNPNSYIEQKIGGWPDKIYTVKPYDTVDLAVILQAPDKPGVYTGYWLLANGSGEVIEPMLWTQIIVEEELVYDLEDWSGKWTFKDSYITIPVLVSGVLNRSDSGQVTGFFYDHKGDVNLIDGWITDDPNVIEGDFGEPRSKQGGIPFRWKILDNHNQFQGVFWLGQLTANEICGSRHGYDIPDPCLLNE